MRSDDAAVRASVFSLRSALIGCFRSSPSFYHHCRGWSGIVAECPGRRQHHKIALPRELGTEAEEANESEGRGEEQENRDLGKDVTAGGVVKGERQIRVHRPGRGREVTQGFHKGGN